MVFFGYFDFFVCVGVLEQVIYVGYDSCCYCQEYGDIVKIGVMGYVMIFLFCNIVFGYVKI